MGFKLPTTGFFKNAKHKVVRKAVKFNYVVPNQPPMCCSAEDVALIKWNCGGSRSFKVSRSICTAQHYFRSPFLPYSQILHGTDRTT